jgi:DNA-directed RNA polymerase subunit RPC12/RpoP
LNLIQTEDSGAQTVKFISYKCSECGEDFNFVQKIPPINGEPTPVQGLCRSCGKEYTLTLYTQSNKKTDEKIKDKKS